MHVSKLNSLGIASKLYLLVTVLMIFIAGTVVTALMQMESMRKSTDEVSKKWLPSVQAVNQMATALTNLRLNSLQHIFADGPGKEVLDKAMAQALKNFTDAQEQYGAELTGESEKAVFSDLGGRVKKYLEQHKKIVELSKQFINSPAQKLYEGESKQAYNATIEVLNALVAESKKGSLQASIESETAFMTAKAAMTVTMLLAIALAIPVSIWIVRSITGPLKSAVEIAHSVADGDLTIKIATDEGSELGKLLAALGRMQGGLIQMVGAVRDSAKNVAMDSAKLSQSSSELSARTSQQASALEETAASMEELNASVKTNADSAFDANARSSDASQLASEGGVVVQDAVTNMKRVNESARRISEIIQVIDGIAFQTNILALNAAVEAARAGDQGRGFAVVASEVRGLAVRSAEAAKQIKTLIETSVTTTSAGSILVNKAGETMQEIVQSIKSVNEIIRQISHASAEQSQGVSQIGEAIAHMDEATQMNAALVEEMSEASAGLKSRALALVASVEKFRLE